MVFQKKGMWKHSMSAKKFSSKQEAWDDYNALVDETPVVEEPAEESEKEEDLSPLEKLWKSADPT